MEIPGAMISVREGRFSHVTVRFSPFILSGISWSEQPFHTRELTIVSGLP